MRCYARLRGRGAIRCQPFFFFPRLLDRPYRHLALPTRHSLFGAKRKFICSEKEVYLAKNRNDFAEINFRRAEPSIASNRPERQTLTAALRTTTAETDGTNGLNPLTR